MRKYDALLLGDGVLAITGWLSKVFYPNKQVICVVHGLDLTFTSNVYQKFWVNFFLPKLDKLIAVGNETVRVAIEKRIHEDKIVFIPNGVDTEKHLLASDVDDLEKVLGKSIANKKTLLTSGRLAKRKGAAWFISNVMPKLPTDFIYIVAGSGPDKENISQAIAENKLEDRVSLLGYVTDQDKNILLNATDLFVQPNIKVAGDMEGFGISVIEAGACRLPVLASDMEGLKDAIKDEKNGFLVQPENADAFAGKITELFAAGSPREIYGENVRNFVIENYSWKNIAQIYLSEIQKIINK